MIATALDMFGWRLTNEEMHQQFSEGNVYGIRWFKFS